eukprot:evm.model.scf_330.6 EVM.evm.TU.scf_330.6   scf_330:47142-53594(-)
MNEDPRGAPASAAPHPRLATRPVQLVWGPQSTGGIPLQVQPVRATPADRVGGLPVQIVGRGCPSFGSLPVGYDDHRGAEATAGPSSDARAVRGGLASDGDEPAKGQKEGSMHRASGPIIAPGGLSPRMAESLLRGLRIISRADGAQEGDPQLWPALVGVNNAIQGVQVPLASPSATQGPGGAQTLAEEQARHGASLGMHIPQVPRAQAAGARPGPRGVLVPATFADKGLIGQSVETKEGHGEMEAGPRPLQTAVFSTPLASQFQPIPSVKKVKVAGDPGTSEPQPGFQDPLKKSMGMWRSGLGAQIQLQDRLRPAVDVPLLAQEAPAPARSAQCVDDAPGGQGKLVANTPPALSESDRMEVGKEQVGAFELLRPACPVDKSEGHKAQPSPCTQQPCQAGVLTLEGHNAGNKEGCHDVGQRPAGTENVPAGWGKKGQGLGSQGSKPAQELGRKSGTPKSGSKLKAKAKPEGPGGVEDCCGGDVMVTVPTDLFKLGSLHDVLNLGTWHKCLNEPERKFLRQFLPEGATEEAEGLLDKLLRGKENFHFGNPVMRLWGLLVEGECHPRVVKYREGLRCLHHAEHFHALREYHNRMVTELMEMATVFEQCKNADISKKLELWNRMTAHRGTSVASSAGPGFERPRRKRKKCVPEAAEAVVQAK